MLYECECFLGTNKKLIKEEKHHNKTYHLLQEGHIKNAMFWKIKVNNTQTQKHKYGVLHFLLFSRERVAIEKQ